MGSSCDELGVVHGVNFEVVHAVNYKEILNLL